MRPLRRQGLHLASQTRARSCNRVRKAYNSSYRHFSASSQRPNDPRSPPRTSEDSPENAGHNEEQEKSDKQQWSAKEVENEQSEPATTPSRLRRTFRQRRTGEFTIEIPKPPPTPQWFLDRNVQLSNKFRQGKLRLNVFLPSMSPDQLVCKDKKSGHTLFTLPYATQMLEKEVSRDLLALALKTARARNRRTGTDQRMDTLSDPMLQFLSRFHFDHSTPASYEQPSAAMRAMEEHDCQQESQHSEVSSEPKVSHEADDAGSSEPTEATKAPSEDGKPQLGQEADISRLACLSAMSWPFLEAQLSIEAAFAIPANCPNQASFAASRVDIALLCSDSNCHENMDHYVRELGSAVGADIVSFDANDFEDLAGEYVGQGRDGPGSVSTMAYDAFHGYVANFAKRPPSLNIDPPKEDHLDPEDEEDSHVAVPPSVLNGLRESLGPDGHLRKQLEQIYSVTIPIEPNSGRYTSTRRAHSAEQDADTEERINLLLDNTLHAAKELRENTKMMPWTEGGEMDERAARWIMRLPSYEETEYASLIEASPEGAFQTSLPIQSDMARHITWASWAVAELVTDLIRAGRVSFKMTKRPSKSPAVEPRTIVHVRDLRELLATAAGEKMVRNLLNVVQKRRNSGERILVVATTAQSGFGSWAASTEESAVHSRFRDIRVPAEKGSLFWTDRKLKSIPWGKNVYNDPTYPRILEINLRHIESMLRKLCPESSIDLNRMNRRSRMAANSETLHDASVAPHLDTPGSHVLTERILTLDEVQRVVLLAYGLSHSLAESTAVTPIHIGLATTFMTRVDNIVQIWSEKAMATAGDAKASDLSSKGAGAGSQRTQGAPNEQKGPFNQHESRLLTGLVNANNIKVGFTDVHAAPDTIEALKTMTTLSLARPDAFKYGVLAADRLPGVLLYGPPGTGKTLLAKAVAKESGATVLEVSGAQIYEKYVGEGEKMVRAVFSLAKKMSPCVVFMDEADALFGARQTGGGRNTHREIINQFLREWDGMEDHKVLMMVASNRPFDLDDAVLRRLPRRLLVDLPVEKDRESILGIHLKNEQLSEDVSIPKLAEQTPLYSGSDLKNLCVAAALACVREENDLAASKKAAGEEWQHPDRRTLHLRHFDTATSEISASINEDMSTLSAIRKFDEQYGDRRGRRKKNAYGFGTAGDGKFDESAARVRQGSPPSSAPPTT